MSRVDDDGIHTCLHQCFHTLESVGCHTHTSSHAQTSLGVLAGIGLVLCLRDVLVGDQTNQFIVAIHYWEFLNLVFQKNA